MTSEDELPLAGKMNYFCALDAFYESENESFFEMKRRKKRRRNERKRSFHADDKSFRKKEKRYCHECSEDSQESFDSDLPSEPEYLHEWRQCSDTDESPDSDTDTCKMRYNEVKTRVMHSKITTRTPEILDEYLQLSRRKTSTKYSGQAHLKKYQCCLRIFPKGHGKKNEGYVSISFKSSFGRLKFEVCLIVSVMDATENERFLRTFNFLNEPYPFIDKYISHKQLLNDPDDLLPNNTLTMNIAVRVTLYSFDGYTDSNPTFDINFTYAEDNGSVKRPALLLDSDLAKRLSEECQFFERIRKTPMKEGITRTMLINKNELEAFKNIELLLTEDSVEFRSLAGIFDLCIVADMYDITCVSETCRCFLKLYASVHGVDKILKFMDDCADEVFKEILEKQINLIGHTNFVEEIVKTDTNVFIKQPVHKCQWAYDYTEKSILLFEENDFINRYNLIVKKNEDHHSYI